MNKSDSNFTIINLLHLTAGVAVFISLLPYIAAESTISPSPILSGSIVMLLAWIMIGLRKTEKRSFWIGFFVAGTCLLITVPFLLKLVTRNIDASLLFSTLGPSPEPTLALLLWCGTVLISIAISLAGGFLARYIFVGRTLGLQKTSDEV